MPSQNPGKRASDGESGAPVGAIPPDADLRQAVEDGLKPRAPLLRLPPLLEQRYEAATWRGRSRGARNWLLVVGALSLCWIGIDAITMPAFTHHSLIARGVLMTTLYLGAAALLMRRRPAWVQGMAVALPTIALMLVTGYLAGLVGGVHAERYNTAALFAAFASTIGPAIAFRYAVLQSVASLAIFEALVIGQTGIVDNIELITFYPASNLAALAAPRRFARMHRRNFLLALRDELRVRELAAANDRLTALSNTDPLTGVSNRRFFDDTFSAAWTRAATARGFLAVMMVDVDHFKAFNDAAGHAEGDHCLQAVAEAMRANVRVESDLVARYGGEEFVAVLPDADLDAALTIAERVRRAVEAMQVPHPGRPGQIVTVSVGVASARLADADLSPEALVQAADTALYAAKATGRNYVCGTPGTDATLHPLVPAPPADVPDRARAAVMAASS